MQVGGNAMRFEFATATRIIFGRGTLGETGQLAAEMGGRALVVVGSNPGRSASLLDLLATHQVEAEVFSVATEPTIEIATAGAEQARAANCDLVIGFGGGSVLDTGKAISALITNPGDPLDYLEVIGQGQPLTQAPVPYIAIPTTAGTGAEVTRNAVLKSETHRVKVSLRHALMLPRLALVDPELTLGLPPAVTASAGMDALSQVIEPYVSNKPNPMTDALCKEGMARAARSLQRAYEHGDNIDAREDMAVTSLFSGLALANAKLGAVHGFAGPLGGMFPAPHGAVCAVLLPHVTAINVKALQGRGDTNGVLGRYRECAQILTGNPGATVADLVAWLEELGAALAIPPLSTYGLTTDDFPLLIQKSSKASSMKGNPLVLTDDEMTKILQRAL